MNIKKHTIFGLGVVVAVTGEVTTSGHDHPRWPELRPSHALGRADGGCVGLACIAGCQHYGARESSEPGQPGGGGSEPGGGLDYR